MGLKISTIAGLPENAERSYYLYILDYYNWDEPISNTLRNSFDKIAAFSAQNDAVVIQGIPESHFFSELMSWESINGIDPKELLPALMITTIHPKYFLEGNDKQLIGGKIPEDKLVFIEINNVCKSSQDVVKVIEKVLQDIKDKKEIKDFRVKKELKGGIGKILNDAIILESDNNGASVSKNDILKFLNRENQ